MKTKRCRPYSAKSIAALRNSIPISYPSSLQGDKLWEILNTHLKNGTCEKTFGTTEPTVVSQMAKHQQVCDEDHLQVQAMKKHR